MSDRSEISPWLHRFAVAMVIATFGLIGVGGLVTSHGVGMSVPDWPTTYGYNMFLFPPARWVGGIYYEHTHRLAASAVGFFTTILMIWFFGRSARPYLRWGGDVLFAIGTGYGIAGYFTGYDAHYTGASMAVVGMIARLASIFWPKCAPASERLRWLGVLAFFGVVLQGVLGGLRVTLLKDQIGIFHAALAQAFLVLVCSLALISSPWWAMLGQRIAAIADSRGLRKTLLFVTALIFFQLVLGATMRHQHAGLAIPDFPLAYGKLWPAIDPASVESYNAHRLQVVETNPITAFQIVLQMVHRFVAVLILCAVAYCAWATRKQLGRSHPLAKVSLFWLVAILAQVGLGAWTIWSGKAADVATLHVMIGALSLVLGALLTIVSFRVLIPAHVLAGANLKPVPEAFAHGDAAVSGIK